jgi:ATP-dependent protease ClpP protease subunit
MTSEEAREYGIVDKVITTREMQNQLSSDKKA